MNRNQIKRRGFLGVIAGLLVAPFVVAKAATQRKKDRDQVEAEYEIRVSGMEGLHVTVFTDGRITVRKGDEALIPTREDLGPVYHIIKPSRGRGWITFLGKYGTKIVLRRPRLRELEIEYYAIVEPRGPNVEDIDYATNGLCNPAPMRLVSLCDIGFAKQSGREIIFQR